MRRSGLLSDLIPRASLDRASSPSRQTQAEGGKGKQKDVPKSEEVRRLEQLKDGVARFKGFEKDPSGGCFCQARDHLLSSYTPMCLHCGLILCTLNLPQYVCPHCSTALHKPEDRDALIAKLDQELEETLRKEEAERERLAQQIQRAQSDFPSLPGTRTPSRSPSSQSLKAQQPPQQTSHKVLSINPKSKKVVISSRVKATSIPASISASPSQDSVSAEPRRIPRPSPEVVYSSKEPDSSRPWAPMMRPRVTYIPPASIVSPTPSKGQRKSVKSP